MTSLPPANPTGGTTPPAAGTTNATPPGTLKIKPKMGGLGRIDPDSSLSTAWTGGKPKRDWSDLDNIVNALGNPIANTYHSILQCRHTHHGSAMKGQEARERGLEVKFGRDGNLQKFQDLVMKHLVKHGMDLISYLPHPHVSTDMISVVNFHSRFDLAPAVVAFNSIKTEYDNYDLVNHGNAYQS
jgi:hypothetical protein